MAPKMIGAKESTEDGNFAARQSGRGASLKQRSRSVSNCGVLRSENADISSESPVENTGCRKPKVSEATPFGFGLVETNRITNR